MLLEPIHTAFIEMFIDPVCSLALEAESQKADLMARPPRALDAPLLPRRLAAICSALIGALPAALSLSFGWVMHLGTTSAAILFYPMAAATLEKTMPV
jgi:Ca2+-transporting ATPase